MTVTRKSLVGELVHVLTAAEENERRSKQGFQPRAGRRVGLWRIDGAWNVWSPGPEMGTWWLLPLDDTAIAIRNQVVEKLDRGAPVIKKVAQGAVAVRTPEIRPGGAR